MFFKGFYVVPVYVMQSTGSEQMVQEGTSLHRTMLKELGHLLVLFELFQRNTTTRILFFQEKKKKDTKV